MRTTAILFALLAMALTQCKNSNNPADNGKGTEAVMAIDITVTTSVIDSLILKFGEENRFRIERGVNQTASFWRTEDGTEEDFRAFCMENFIADPDILHQTFLKLSENYEILAGNLIKVNLELNRPLHLDMGEILPIDMLFGAYDPMAHLDDDFFANKIAMIVSLNFPFYSLEEKEKLGPEWTRQQWAYARMGDKYTSRVPAALLQKKAETTTNADTYISEYNIFMGYLQNDQGEKLFPEDLRLITHWGLRDELKSNYGIEGGLAKQEMIYEVMKDIITQDIPADAINSNEYCWNPYSDKLIKDGKEVEFTKEPDTRYEHLLNNFKAMQEIDKYSPRYPSYIQRKFDMEMEIKQEDVEKLFIQLVSSPEVKDVAKIIEARLGRPLQPFDIWYNGFKSRGVYTEEDLNKITRTKYPDCTALQKDLPEILRKLGWDSERANEIASKVSVDPSRGAGHAWGAEMKSDVSHLRTRIAKTGMDYKGYNIAVHEFGHNVEQTITIQNIDYYMLHGVPNTAFTEAIAFIFQKRDLELLGLTKDDPEKMNMMALDNFWSCYEIMGVSLVDMGVWKWMYEHPDATPAELKVAVIDIAKDVWNKYYADVFGVKDSPILAVYSHMIDAPLYLSAYPIGQLIQFQVEQYLEGKSFPNELERILVQGRIIPQVWMNGAVGNRLSADPLLAATRKAVNEMK